MVGRLNGRGVGQPLGPTAATPRPPARFPGPFGYREPERASITARRSRDFSHLPNFALQMCSLDFLRQARMAHCRHPSLTCLSRLLIPPRAFTIIANPSRVFFPEKDIHHDRTQPPSPVRGITSIANGKKEPTGIFKEALSTGGSKRKYPL